MEKRSIHQLFRAELERLSNAELYQAYSLLSKDEQNELLVALLDNDTDSFEKLFPGSIEYFNELKNGTLNSIDDAPDELKEDQDFQLLLSKKPSQLIRLLESEADMTSAIMQSERTELKSFLSQIDHEESRDFEEDLEKAIISSERKELKEYLREVDATSIRAVASAVYSKDKQLANTASANRIRTRLNYFILAACIVGFGGLVIYFSRNNTKNDVPLVSNNDVVKDTIQTDTMPKGSVQDPVLIIPDSKEYYAEYQLGQPENYGFSSDPPLVKVTVHDLSASIEYLEEQLVLEAENGAKGYGPNLKEIKTKLESLMAYDGAYTLGHDADLNEFRLHYFVNGHTGTSMRFYKKECALFGLGESTQTDLIIQIKDDLFSLELTKDKKQMKKVNVELDPDCE